MREEFKYDTYRDFIQRYQNTYGWYEKDDGSKVLVQVGETYDNVCHFKNKDGVEYRAYADKGNHFSFLPVQQGVYNTAMHGVVYCKRIPARQYKRGICEANTHVESLTRGHRLDVTFDLVEDMFGEQSDAALRAFKTTRVTDVALNTLFAIVNQRVYVYNHLIGELAHGSNEIVLNDTLLKQEVEDVVVQTGLDFFVRVK